MPDKRLTTASKAVDPAEVVAVLTPSPMRRWVTLVIWLGLAALLIGLSFMLPKPNLLTQAALIGIGAFLLWRMRVFYEDTAQDLILSRSGLFDSTGRELFSIADVASVERGAFSAKPSNGFAVILTQAQPRAWVPGMWWRIGRRVGVGGVIPGKAARDMADVIAMMLQPDGAALIDQALRDKAESNGGGAHGQ